ncbi:MAG: DUF1565 domain-containing protein [Planctomycetes bacterium]|nr:DUF1565 domain-containing protein [Planctomycetota bacterium]
MSRFLLGLTLFLATAVASAAEVRSHPPLRQTPKNKGPFPVAALTLDTARVVHPTEGDDKKAGTLAAPWRTIKHALTQLKPGQTLYLHEGTYYENVYVALAGRPGAPITIRSVPGELAVIDGGLREFFDAPQDAWEPEPNGRPGEYRSKKAYPNRRDVLGSFGDSMIGLQTYHHARDLRATNELFDWENWDKIDQCDLKPVYLGPGVWYDRETGRVHIRLARTNLPKPVPNYTGETDPRKLPLVLAPFNSVPLHLDGAKHVRIADVMIRGAGYTAIQLDHAQHVEFDNVTVWCGTYGVRAGSTGPLKLSACRFYGNVAPWTFRTDGSKRDYPGRPHRNLSRMNTHALIEIDSGRESGVYATPQNDNWEIEYCEFTDAHDGVYLGGINVKFHHNLLDGLQDDGIYLSPMYARHRLDKKDAEIHLYQNRFGTMLTALAFGGTEPLAPDKVFVYRNVFDLRGALQIGRPTARRAEPGLATGKVIGDHGSPPWSAMNIYHNTFVTAGGSRDAAMATFAASKVAQQRRVFNNVFLHGDRLPAFAPPDPAANCAADGNVYWAPNTPEKTAAAFFDKFRKSDAFPASQKLYAAGSTTNCRVADPRLDKELRVEKGSPLIDAGIALPAEWPDPLRKADKGTPDIGALPQGGRLDVGRANRLGRDW